MDDERGGDSDSGPGTTLELELPEGITEELPDDGGRVARDMDRSVRRLEERVAHVAGEREDREDEDEDGLAALIDEVEANHERYGAFVPELRAWGQSPVYALAWRDLQAALAEQLRAFQASDSPRPSEVDRADEQGNRERNPEYGPDGRVP
jgi:hypothetical protein